MFWVFENRFFSLKIFENSIFIGYFFKISEFLKIMKIRDISLIAPFILNLLLKTIWFYLSSSLRDNVSRVPLFLPKTEKTWRHSGVICGRRMRRNEFSFCQNVPNWWLEGNDNLVIVRL